MEICILESAAMGKLLTSLAMQQGNVHLGRQGAGIELINHFDRGSGVASQGQQVNIAPKNQPKGDGRVTQAVQGSVCAVRPCFEA